MNQPAMDVADRLRSALESGDLSPAQEDRGENLLSRLKSPVRIAILGPRRSGKSSLLNVLAGARVLPEGKALPTLQLTWGETAETTCIYGDGTRRQFADAKPQDLVALSPIFIEMRRRLPALRTVALLEVVMDGTQNQKERALKWAAQRCDLALWCTASFDDEEQALWESMPAMLQAHATLVLTRADRFDSTEAIADRLAELGGKAAGRFRDIRPLAALQALSAFHSDGSAEAGVLQRSGGQALIGSLLTEVEKGRMAIRNAAEALLLETARTEMVVDLPAGVVFPTETTEPTPAADETTKTAAAEPVPAKAPAPEPATKAAEPAPVEVAETPVAVAPVEVAEPPVAPPPDLAPEPKVEPAPAPIVIEETPSLVAKPALSEEGREALAGVVSYLSGRALEMTEMLDASETAATDDIVPALLDDANWLTEFLAAPFHADDAFVAETRSVAFDIADLIQLMEMERSETAAADAACLMLQAKRDIQALLAA